jgi:acyl-CoA synthetase (AMP-forming)/AMP-acid ligase II
MLAGMTVVPLVNLLGDSDIEQILDLSGARGMLSERKGRKGDITPHLALLAADRPALRVLILEGGEDVPGCELLERSDPTLRPVASADAETSAMVILFTSGTTSAPKGAIHSSGTLFAEVEDFGEMLDLGAKDARLLQPFPLGHAAGIISLLTAVCIGREVNVMSAWRAPVALDIIDRHAVTTMASTPYFAQTLFDERERRGHGLETLRTMLSGGGNVGSELVMRADGLGISLSRSYGSTEHPSVSAHRFTDPVQLRANSDGRPTNGSEVRIVDADDEPVPTGNDGEVQLRGPEQFLGYLSGDRSCFAAGGWFRTGDLGRLSGDGYLTITGRLKEIIIRAGENISIPEVEAALVRFPTIEEAAVVAVPDPRYGERAYAFVVTDGSDVALDEVVEHFVKLELAKFKIPEWVEVVPEFPRNSMGKVLKKSLEPRLLEIPH